MHGDILNETIEFENDYWRLTILEIRTPTSGIKFGYSIQYQDPALSPLIGALSGETGSWVPTKQEAIQDGKARLDFLMKRDQTKLSS